MEMIPESEVGCAENIANTVVFVRFHFFTYFVNLLISNRLLGVFHFHYSRFMWDYSRFIWQAFGSP